MPTKEQKRSACRSFLPDIAVVLLGAVGTALHFRQFGWAMFQFYTLDSNLFLLAACAVQAWYGGAILLGKRRFVPSWVRLTKYLAVCTVMVTFFVVLFVLVPLSGGFPVLPYYLFHGAMLYHHTLCPLLGALSFVFADRVSLPDRRVTLWATIPTVLYAAVAIALNIARVLHGPYPFLLVYEQPVWMSALWCAAILALAWGLALLVWKLSLRFTVPRRANASPLFGAEAWTADGYLKDQDALSDFTYRSISAGDNGCGPVAAFNLRQHAGQDPAFSDVLAEMDGMHLLRIPGPTFLHVMRRYLDKYLPGRRETHGRGAALAAAERSVMGVFRYHEQRVPHFVAYYRLDGGAFRFFNVCDGKEDAVMTIAEFGERHLLGGSVRLIWWE